MAGGTPTICCVVSVVLATSLTASREDVHLQSPLVLCLHPSCPTPNCWLLHQTYWAHRCPVQNKVRNIHSRGQTYYTPRFNEVERGVYWFHLVCLSICGQNRFRSVSSTILIGSISYLHILSSNFRRCVACNVCFKIQKLEILPNSLNWLLSLLTFDSIVWVIMRRSGVSVVLVIQRCIPHI